MSKKRLFIISVAAILGFIALFQVLNQESEMSTDTDVEMPDPEFRTGADLAIIYCSGCHLFPEPDLLDKRTWATQTLPAMGPHLGIFEFQGEEYSLDQTPNLPENFYPDRALIDSTEWQSILDYYEEESPERLTVQTDVAEIITDDHIFAPKRPGYRTDTNPMVSAIKFDPGNGLIYLGDATVQKILVYNRDLDIVANFDTPTPVSDIQFLNDPAEPGIREMIITFIGDIAPSDRRDGSIVKGWYDPESGEGDFSEVIIDDIGRPVETLIADLDGDGIDDLLVSEFGHRTGSIFWLKGENDIWQTEKLTLIDVPGCLQSEVLDFTGNGRPDIVALCSQLDQALYLFENEGDGEFRRKTLMQFPITAGSSSFDLADFNEDGHLDLVYTSGDNADYSITYKPYHGVYIYENDGENQFTEKWFYPVNGAYLAKAGDFNGNGKPDIAMTSFFADYAQKPQEGFIYFEQTGEYNFTPYHPQASSFGRWITMDVADWTGNSVDDIVLANFSMGPTKVHPQIEQILTQSPHLLVLENRSLE